MHQVVPHYTTNTSLKTATHSQAANYFSSFSTTSVDPCIWALSIFSTPVPCRPHFPPGISVLGLLALIQLGGLPTACLVDPLFPLAPSVPMHAGWFPLDIPTAKSRPLLQSSPSRPPWAYPQSGGRLLLTRRRNHSISPCGVRLLSLRALLPFIRTRDSVFTWH